MLSSSVATSQTTARTGKLRVTERSPNFHSSPVGDGSSLVGDHIRLYPAVFDTTDELEDRFVGHLYEHESRSIEFLEASHRNTPVVRISIGSLIDLVSVEGLVASLRTERRESASGANVPKQTEQSGERGSDGLTSDCDGK